MNSSAQPEGKSTQMRGALHLSSLVAQEVGALRAIQPGWEGAQSKEGLLSKVRAVWGLHLHAGLMD